MTIDQFFTAHTAPKGSIVAQSASIKGAGATTGEMATSSGNFFDLFLQNAVAALEAQKAKAAKAETSTTAKVSAPEAEISTLPPADDLSMEDLASLLNNLEPGANDNALGITAEELGLSEEELLSVKEVLKNAFLISDEKSMRPALNNLQRVLQELEKIAQGNDAEALIVTNMTPEQITDLKIKVESLLAGEHGTEALEENAENFAGLVIGLIKILPPQAKNDFVATGKAIILAGDDGSAGLIGIKDLRARLNALEMGSVNKGSATDAGSQDMIDTGGGDDDFEAFLKQFAQDTKSAKDGAKTTLADAMAGDKSAAGAASKAEIAAGVVKGLTPPMTGGLFSTAEFTQGSMQEMGMVFGQTQISSVSPMTSLVTQSHAVTLPHPATQAVAASIQKNAATGETKNITLRLDPPELGRVEIKMSFGKDSAVKAVMTIEKPETFLMLQRDAHILERALQDAGLEADGNSLSFEMAQDGQDFSQDGGHDGSRNQSGAQGSEDNGMNEIIQSTMTWHIDPASGHMRYNILA